MKDIPTSITKVEYNNVIGRVIDIGFVILQLNKPRRMECIELCEEGETAEVPMDVTEGLGDSSGSSRLNRNLVMMKRDIERSVVAANDDASGCGCVDQEFRLGRIVWMTMIA